MTHHRYWPIFDLRLQTPDLLLRPMTEDDQFRLAEILPPDLELRGVVLVLVGRLDQEERPDRVAVPVLDQ